MKKILNNDEISPLKKLIEEQKNEISQLKTIIDDLPGDVYWKHFSNGKLVYSGMNRTGVESLQKMGFKWKKEDILGKSDDNLFDQETANIFFKNDLEVMQSSVSRTREETAVLPSGKKLTQLSTKRPLFDEKGNIVGISGVSIDISELKETQTALQVSLEKAEAADKAKTEFLENMRHDIRTPLTGIIGCAQLLQLEKEDSAKIAEYTHDLMDSSQALLDFLNRILDSIQVASGEIPLLKLKFDFRKELEAVIKLNKSLASAKKLTLKFHYDENIPAYLVGDPVRLQRIVLELITNAVTFTQQGEVEVNVKLKQQELRRVIIEIVVRDTGIGIPSDKQLDIYTRFKRLTPAYQGIYPGAGLGLSLVKQFLEDVDGEIYLKSRPNKGSTFTCYIPFLKPLINDDADIAETQRMRPLKKSRVVQLMPALDAKAYSSRILVVEDQSIAAKMARQLLSELHCQVDIAMDGASALEHIREEDYDLIFMDIGLPDMDGIELTRRIRLEQWKRVPLVPIIGLTAHMDAESKRRCLAAGMDAIFSKPLDLNLASEILSGFIPSYQLPVAESGVSKPEEQPSRLPLLDIDKTKKLLGTESLVKEMFGLLVDCLSKDIKVLGGYYRAQNKSGMKEIMHKWKGNAVYCGALRLKLACVELETVLDNAELSEKIEAAYRKLLREATATKEAAMQYLAQP